MKCKARVVQRMWFVKIVEFDADPTKDLEEQAIEAAGEVATALPGWEEPNPDNFPYLDYWDADLTDVDILSKEGDSDAL